MRSQMLGETFDQAPRGTRRRVYLKYLALVVLALGVFWGVTVLGASKVVWQTDYAAAVEDAKRSNRPLLLDFWASWCPPCRLMDGRIFSSNEVAAVVHRDFVPVRIDLTNDDPESPQAAIARQFEVSAMPTLLVVDPVTEEILTRPKHADEDSTDAFIQFLEKAAKH